MVPVLPRAGWLAVGAIVAALLAGDVGAGTALAVVVISGGSIALLTAGIGAALRRRTAVAALLLGAGSVALRWSIAVWLAGPGGSAPLPIGSDDFGAQVVDTSAPAGMEQRAMVRVHAPDRPDEDWLVYAWLPRHPALVPGDRVLVRGSLSPPPADAPGFAGFLESRGAVGTLKAHTVELAAVGPGVSASIERLRRALDDALSRVIPEPEAGLAAGILIGLRERVSPAVADDFMTTGLTHVVAISGWNIALVAGIATALLRATGIRRRPRSAIVLLAIVAYTILAGAEASVIRAAAMGGVVIVARESGRPSSAAAALGVACWGLLLVDPGMIEDIGLQLSLAATAGLLALAGPAESMVRRLTREHTPRWFSESLGVSLAAQLATLPLILLHFGRLSLISPVANVLVAPVVPLAMLGAAVGTLLGPLVAGSIQALVAPVLLAAWLPLTLMTRGAHVLAQVPLANVELTAPFDGAAGALALLALFAVLRRTRRSRHARRISSVRPVGGPSWSAPGAPDRQSRRPRRLAVVLAATALAASSAIVLAARPAPSLEVSVLDVGQGDAILLESRDGSRILVDGGPDPDLLVRRLDERIPLWDRRVDLAILTHPHEDHSGGLAGLLPRYRIGRIGETGMASDGAGVRELRAVAARASIRRVRLAQGDELALGRARVRVLWPPREHIPESAPSGGRAVNDTSIVLDIAIGRQRILLTGDLEEDRDADLIETLPRDVRRWDLLKVAHHGSATATSEMLLEVLRPRLAAISSGIDNRYGHPAPPTLERLLAAGARVHRTDRDGTLTFSFDGRPRTAAALLAGPPRRSPCATIIATPDGARPGQGVACYARPDGGPDSHRSALAAPVHLAVTAIAAPYDGGGRGGVVPGLSCGAGGSHRRSAPGRDSRAPPRCRQGIAA